MISMMQGSPNAATAQTRPDLIPCCSPRSQAAYAMSVMNEANLKIISVLKCLAFAICLLTANSPANLHPLF